MVNRIKSLKFFVGGKAIFTISNSNGVHYTYKIVHKAEQPYFVYLLTDGDEYRYMGLYNPVSNLVYLTQKSRFTDGSIPLKVLRWAIKVVKYGDSIPEGYSIQHDGRCCRCGRRLTTPESIEAGIGPECSKRV